MQVSHIKTILPPQKGIAQPQGICWSPNNKRLAVADANRVVHLFDESCERRDKFPTKAADGKGGKSFLITGMVFSPDSNKIAVAQSDNLVSIYRIGCEWGEKKSICNKFTQSSSISCVVWPNTATQGVELIVFGTHEGKVKVGVLKANKSQTLYAHEHAAVTMATNTDGTRVVCGHLDGTVFVYTFDPDEGSTTNANSSSTTSSTSAATSSGVRRLFTHSCVPLVLSWGEHIIAAGADCAIAFYHPRTGQRVQTLDYAVADEGEFSSGAVNPSGQALAITSRNCLRLCDYNTRAHKWDEGVRLELPHSHSFPVLSWKHDGSRLVVGSVTGAVDVYDTCLKRYRLRGAFEFTYVALNQVIVKRLATGTRIVLRSTVDQEVQNVNVHQDRYLVAHTSSTLLVGDLISCRLSEVPWQLTGREKFVFDNPQVCMVFTAGELCLIEYGVNALLGTCRTQEHNAHRISVRIYTPKANNHTNNNNNNNNNNNSGRSHPDASSSATGHAATSGSEGCAAYNPTGADGPANTAAPPASPNDTKRRIAYLIDRQTIQVDDLTHGISLARIPHTHKVDWLELNYRADKLLFRDKQHQLHLFDLTQMQRTTLLNYCTYVQWVPGSDVVVAQNRVELCVWYSIDHTEQIAIIPIKGEVDGMERGAGKTEVMVDEGDRTVAYALDEPLIEFGAAMDDRDWARACDLLESIAPTPEAEAMWATLAAVSLQERELTIAERCDAALGNVARVQALQQIRALARVDPPNGGTADGEEGDGVRYDYNSVMVRAALLALNKDFKAAEQLYLENNKVHEAMQMWEEMNCFDAALAIAEQRHLDDVATRRARYFAWLMESRQFDRAGSMREQDGKYVEALNLYLRGGTPMRAAQLVTSHQLRPESALLEAIAAALLKARVYEQAGLFFAQLNMPDRALETFVRGHVYRRARELAQQLSASGVLPPERVLTLEEQWGDYLVQQKHVDQAINHYTAAHAYEKAVRAALDSRQWSKAAEILERYTDELPSGTGIHASASSAADDAEAKRAPSAAAPLPRSTLRPLYHTLARHYEEIRQYAEAEKFFVLAEAVREAVDMYSRANLTDAMYRVAQRHLSAAQLAALFGAQAKQLEAKGDYAGAERMYIKMNEPDQAIVMYKKLRDTTNMIRLVQLYRPDFLLKTHLALGAQLEHEGNWKVAETHYVAGKDWGRAVNMYRDHGLWEEAVRVAKLHGGASAAQQVILSRVMLIDAEEGVALLRRFHLVEPGIEYALESHKFDLALQWAQLALPSKVTYVYLKYAMYYEDQGDFHMAEEAFIKSGKPREAIDMYVHQHDFDSARRVAESHDGAAVAGVCAAQGRAAFQQGRTREAEALLLRAGAPESLLKMYLDAHQYAEAQRVAKAHCPEMLGEVARRIALQSNDPQRAGAVLEENGEYQLAMDLYTGATAETVPEPAVLASVWVRAVKVAQKHARKSLKEVLQTVTAKLAEAGRFADAGRVLEECEDYKGAINQYVRGEQFELAEALAKRVSPELEDYVRRAIVQSTIAAQGRPGGGGGGASMRRDGRAIEAMDPETAMRAYMTNNDWPNALRMAQSRSLEEQHYVAALTMQFHLREGNLRQAMEVVLTHPLDPKDFRFYASWLDLGKQLVPRLPLTKRRLMTADGDGAGSMNREDATNDASASATRHTGHETNRDDGSRIEDEESGSSEDEAVDLSKVHAYMVALLESITAYGQDADDVAQANALVHIIHIYHMSHKMRTQYNLSDCATKLMLGLPRWMPFIAADKAYYDAGMAAKHEGWEDVAFLYLSRALDIVEHIEDGNTDGDDIDPSAFAQTDFPALHMLPRRVSVPAASMERVNEWVLTKSIEATDHNRALPTVTDPQTQETFFAGSLKAPSGATFAECAVTGYPIVGDGVLRCSHCKRPALQAEWNRLVVISKQCPWCDNLESPDFK